MRLIKRVRKLVLIKKLEESQASTKELIKDIKRNQEGSRNHSHYNNKICNLREELRKAKGTIAAINGDPLREP